MTTGGWITLAVFLALLVFQWHRADRYLVKLYEERQAAIEHGRLIESRANDNWARGTHELRARARHYCDERDAARTALAEVLRELAASTPTEDART